MSQQTRDTQWTEALKDDLRWEAMDSTNVETKTFYMTTGDGKLGLVQIIYSNVLGVRTTAQFNAKIIDAENATPELWVSDNLPDFEFSADRHNFSAQGCSVEISEDGKSYRFKSSKNKACIVDLTFTQAAPGFQIGRDGTTYFGTDPTQPWGRMRHLFWPRCEVKGTFETEDGLVYWNGLGLFHHALQGMKPHFAAARWNFANFQSPSYSAVLMEFTTPASYGETVVAVGGIATDGEILFANASPAVTHDEVARDSLTGWLEPKAVTYEWTGKTAKGVEASAQLKGDLGERVDRVDVMGELPAFLKQIVAGASGATPYIYQVSKTLAWSFIVLQHAYEPMQYFPNAALSLSIGGEHEVVKGRLFAEATFIS